MTAGRAVDVRTFAILVVAGALLALAPASASAQSADLSIAKADSAAPVTVGDEFECELTVANQGPGTATAVMVEDTLPNQVSLISAEASQGDCVQRGARRVDCALGTVPNGDSATVTLRVLAERTGEAVNTATVEAAQADPDPANDEAAETTTIVAAKVRGCAGEEATIVGTPGDDVLVGTAGRDVIAGRAGDDVLRGLGGDDVICGGRGSDRLRGGAGSDLAKGGADADRLRGKGGDDTLRGNGGDDNLGGGAGADVLHGGRGADRCAGGPGRDTRKRCE